MAENNIYYNLNILKPMDNDYNKYLKKILSIKGIGKKKALLLVENGYNSFHQINISPIEKLIQINGISEKLAKSLKKIAYNHIRDEQTDLFNEYKKSIKNFIKSPNSFKPIDIELILRLNWKIFCKKFIICKHFNTLMKKLNKIAKSSIVLIFILSFVLLGFLYFYPMFDSDIGNIMLSLFMGLSAIFAITFSILFISAQLSSKYGNKLTFFIFSNITYSYIFLFIFSIIIPVLVAKTKNHFADSFIIIPNLILFLGFLCLIILPFYLKSVVKNFNPILMIRQLELKITKEIDKILSHRYEKPNKLFSYIDQIDTLIMKSFEERDFETFKNGYLTLLRFCLYIKEIKNIRKINDNAIFLNLSQIEFELEKRLREIKIYYLNEIRAGCIIGNSLYEFLTYLSDKLITLNEGNKIKLYQSTIIEILDIYSKDFMSHEYSDNDYIIFKESLSNYRKVSYQFCEMRQFIFIDIITENLIKSITNFKANFHNKNQIEDITIELLILKKIIKKWNILDECNNNISRIDNLIMKLNKKILIKYENQANEIIDKELPRLRF